MTSNHRDLATKENKDRPETVIKEGSGRKPADRMMDRTQHIAPDEAEICA